MSSLREPDRISPLREERSRDSAHFQERTPRVRPLSLTLSLRERGSEAEHHSERTRVLHERVALRSDRTAGSVRRIGHAKDLRIVFEQRDERAKVETNTEMLRDRNAHAAAGAERDLRLVV